MIRQSLGLSAGDRDQINVEVAVVLAAECHLCSVRREDGMRFQADAGSQATCLSPSLVDDPKVARIAKRDVLGADGRMIEESSAVRLPEPFRPTRATSRQNRALAFLQAGSFNGLHFKNNVAVLRNSSDVLKYF